MERKHSRLIINKRHGAFVRLVPTHVGKAGNYYVMVPEPLQRRAAEIGFKFSGHKHKGVDVEARVLRAGDILILSHPIKEALEEVLTQAAEAVIKQQGDLTSALEQEWK